MVPKSLLSEKDYDSLLDGLKNHPSPSDFLRACEADFLAVNRDFYPLLLRALRKEQGRRMSELNRFLLVNPGHPYDEAKRMFLLDLSELEEIIYAGEVAALRAYMRGLKSREGTPTDKPAVSEPNAVVDLFTSPEAMEKALAAARCAGLINEAGKWAFTGYKTHAVSLFWVAAIAAGLARPTAPVYKVSPFLAKIFDVPFGPNAINKRKKAEEYDRGTDDNVFQRLYNELLTQMGK